MFNLGTWINNKDRALPSRRLPWWLSSKESDALFETRVESLDQEDPLERTCQSTPVFLPRGSHGQRSLAGCSPWGRRELDTTETPGTQHTRLQGAYTPMGGKNITELHTLKNKSDSFFLTFTILLFIF